jgi:arylsulfatase A-like enzyme
MNIILVVFDSLRKDCLGVYGQPFWGKVHTPHFDAFARQALTMTRAFPESLPTLPTRRALYTGKRVYPFHGADFRLKGDFVGAPGWGPIPEEQPTLAEILKENGYRTGLVADVYHMFKPSKNYWRGFDQWLFLRGQEKDPARSGPRLTQPEIDYWLPKEMQDPNTIEFIQQCIMNMHDRTLEEDYFAARVMKEAAKWLEQNQDAEKFFLVVESFDPHEPWLVPRHYRKLYDSRDGQEQVKSGYNDTTGLKLDLLKRTQANYSGLVTLCDRWFGYFMESLRVLGALENTLVIVTADHGHSIGDYNFMGKRGYPSSPEVYEVPLMVRFPDGTGAGRQSDLLVQHTDISAEILKAAGINPDGQVDGKPFAKAAIDHARGFREHVTVAWGSAVTVVNERWWLNIKVNGKGAFLFDLNVANPWGHNVADANPEIVKFLFKKALDDAAGNLPNWLIRLAEEERDAPGCSDLAARELWAE